MEIDTSRLPEYLGQSVAVQGVVVKRTQIAPKVFIVFIKWGRYFLQCVAKPEALGHADIFNRFREIPRGSMVCFTGLVHKHKGAAINVQVGNKHMPVLCMHCELVVESFKLL